ncbi:MAG: exodeoxyribonuclease VII large subunit [Anaerolineae bacterium]|nr:exodeoxyribonuclease VII large subunit [Anaerolineae bacterium]
MRSSRARPGSRQYQLPGLTTWTVSQLTDYIKEVLEVDAGLQDVWLEAEVSNLTQSTAGHLYFTLKDSGAALNCVMWRSAAAQLGWLPKQGDAVVAHGRVSVYPARGLYQLYVDQLQPAGLGDLHARFEELRDRLKAEGLFDIERKLPLPAFPRVVGVVTSPQAAALRDVLNILQRRYPLVQVLLAPALVQGEQAPAQIVSALQALDTRDDVDLILLVRGGGSLEELWAFNDERVARAIAACRYPVITGVGHETDFTIADFVADLRAPTPSAAAELAVPDQSELRQRLQAWARQAEANVEWRLRQAREVLVQQQHSLRRLSPQARIDSDRQRVDDLIRRSSRALEHNLSLHRAGVAGFHARLAALSPNATLQRGYAIVRLAEVGTVVRSIQQVRAGDRLAIQVQDGEFGAVTREDL